MLRDALYKKGISKREAEVVELVTTGISNKEVAEKLFVTEKTVKFHLTNIYKKMNVKSRAQLIVWCLPHLGFVEQKESKEVNNEEIQVFTNNVEKESSESVNLAQSINEENTNDNITGLIPGQGNNLNDDYDKGNDDGNFGMSA